jgi:iron complex transport system substrate-binding protein
VTLDPHTLSDVLDSIGAVGAALDAGHAAATLVSSLRERLATVAAALDAQTCATPSVFVLEWADPPFVSGHWVPELVIAAGGDPVLCEPGARSHPTDWGAVANAGADIVIVAPCGYDTAGAALQARQVLHRLPVDSQVWAVDANAYIVRPGPRLIDGVELLAAIFHPDCFGVPPADRAIRIR